MTLSTIDIEDVIELETNNNPKIYIACLAAYNDGHLHGKWVIANQDVELIKKEIVEILRTSPVSNAEEWAIHDYENFYDAEDFLGEYPSLEDVVKVAEFVMEHGKIASALIDDCRDIDDAIRMLNEEYAGVYDSLADFAEESYCENNNIPDNLVYYIDWEKMGEDMVLGGDITSIETGWKEVHIFWNH
jgi:antirestriction protein